MTGPVAVTTQNFAGKTRSLLTQVNLHYAAVGLLGLVNVYLLMQMGFAYQAARSQNAEAIAQQTVALRTAEIQARPLQGLDAKLEQATSDADSFYLRRLPYAYSQVAGEVGALAKSRGVKLTRVQYAQSPVLEAAVSSALTEVRMDASLSGDYRALVLFVNSLERDRMFFLISGVTLTGQQSGTVGLRLRLTTYLRPPVGDEGDDKLKALPDEDVSLATGGGAAPASGGPAR